MIKHIPYVLVEMMMSGDVDNELNGVEIFCGEYDPKEVENYLREATHIEGNKLIKNFFQEYNVIDEINTSCSEYCDEGVNGVSRYKFKKDMIKEMLGDKDLKDVTLSFNIEEILGMRFQPTPNGIFVTMHDGMFFQRDYQMPCDGIRLDLDSLKSKFPGIKYDGCYCYQYSDPSCGAGVFERFGTKDFQSDKIENDLRSMIKSFISYINGLDEEEWEFFDFLECENSIVSFLIENDMYEQVEEIISFFVENEDYEEYVSSEEFDEAINTLSDKKKISQDLLENLLDCDVISDSLRDILEEYGENDPDDDEYYDEEDYDDEDE